MSDSARVAARPADEPLVHRIGHTLVETARAGLGLAGDTPGAGPSP